MTTIEEIRAEIRAYAECQKTKNTEGWIKSNTQLRKLYEISLEMKENRERIAWYKPFGPQDPLVIREARYDKLFQRLDREGKSIKITGDLMNLISNEIGAFKMSSRAQKYEGILKKLQVHRIHIQVDYDKGDRFLPIPDAITKYTDPIKELLYYLLDIAKNGQAFAEMDIISDISTYAGNEIKKLIDEKIPRDAMEALFKTIIPETDRQIIGLIENHLQANQS